MLVLDFSQFLSGPYAGLRLADLGARVIKIERPDGGDICRRLYISNLELDGDSTLFHSINRNKESYAVDLKNATDRGKLRKLLQRADVMIQNFRPGVIEKLGFGYDDVRTINPRLVYGSISGYGKEGPLVKRPGQDLLVQSFVGLPWLQRTSRTRSGPIPFGLAIADMMTGSHLAQGILAALVRRAVSGIGALVEVSLLESTLDAMQELWVVRERERVQARAAHSSTVGVVGAARIKESASGATGTASDRDDTSGQAGYGVYTRNHVASELPAGLYRVKDGYIAIERASLTDLCAALGIHYAIEESAPVSAADVLELLQQQPAACWLEKLRAAGLVCEELWSWQQLVQHEVFRGLDMTRQVRRPSGAQMTALACPIRLNGQRPDAGGGAPIVGEHNARIESEWQLVEARNVEMNIDNKRL
ncbi:CaiB/BaiF CoA-transferase family protein [Paenibacillus sp. YYML68]|uniref:CaiB/BaiF CoA transferase family protein n=1 Tax=Paenibacillus sp. YYML68 TaxID=2909250 RepID=UPI00248F8DA7|nr:CaiB/BaiF CoA-transferase family protein [Paenibacillus sp. YYML68]